MAEEFVDFHGHTDASNDASRSYEDFKREAKENGVSRIMIQEHHYFRKEIERRQKRHISLDAPYHKDDGLIVYSGVEVTCRDRHVLNRRDRPVKVHLNIAGLSLQGPQPLLDVLRLKVKNDFDCDFGVLMHMLKSSPKGRQYSEAYVREYAANCIAENHELALNSKAFIKRFLEDHKITLSTSYRRMANTAPSFERLNLWLDDIIKLAHYGRGVPGQTGGLVIFNHPADNLSDAKNPGQLVDSLLKAGIDGVEKYYKHKNSSLDRMVESRAKALGIDLLVSGGSDAHHEGQRVIKVPISKVQPLIDALDDIKEARENGTPTKRRVSQISKEEAEAIVARYQREYNDIVRRSSMAESVREIDHALRERQAEDWSKRKSRPPCAELEPDGM